MIPLQQGGAGKEEEAAGTGSGSIPAATVRGGGGKRHLELRHALEEEAAGGGVELPPEGGGREREGSEATWVLGFDSVESFSRRDGGSVMRAVDGDGGAGLQVDGEWGFSSGQRSGGNRSHNLSGKSSEEAWSDSGLRSNIGRSAAAFVECTLELSPSEEHQALVITDRSIGRSSILTPVVILMRVRVRVRARARSCAFSCSCACVRACM